MHFRLVYKLDLKIIEANIKIKKIDKSCLDIFDKVIIEILTKKKLKKI